MRKPCLSTSICAAIFLLIFCLISGLYACAEESAPVDAVAAAKDMTSQEAGPADAAAAVNATAAQEAAPPAAAITTPSEVATPTSEPAVSTAPDAAATQAPEAASVSSTAPSVVSSVSPSPDPDSNHSIANESTSDTSEEMPAAPSDGSASEKTPESAFSEGAAERAAGEASEGASERTSNETSEGVSERTSDETSKGIELKGTAPASDESAPDMEDSSQESSAVISPDSEEPAGKAPAEKTPVGDDPAGDDPAGYDPAGDDPAGKMPEEELNGNPSFEDPDKAAPDDDDQLETASGETASANAMPDANTPDITAADIVSAAQETLAKAIETFSITLRNLVYGTPVSEDLTSLTATFVLKIAKKLISDDLLSNLTGWSMDSLNLNYEYTVNLDANSEPVTVRGIPSICPVKITTTASGSEGEFSKSFIVDGKYVQSPAPRTVEMNEDGNQTGDHEFSLIRVQNQGTQKPLFVINDSDIALKLSLDVEGTPFVFFIGGSTSGSANPTPDSPAEITLPSKAYGFLSADGNVSDSTKVRITPIGATVNQSISPDWAGSYSETDGFWSLKSGESLKDGSYVMFRVEEPKTDNSQEEEKTPSNPETPSGESEPESEKQPETQPETETPPANPSPEGSPSSPAPKKKKDTKAPSNPDENRTYRNTTSAPSDATSSGRTTAVDTADRTPVELYVVMMIAAAAAAMALRRIRK